MLGPLAVRIHGRLHPDETDPFDYDWLATSSHFKGELHLPVGFPSLEAEELLRFRSDLLSMVARAVSENSFTQCQPLCAISLARRDDGLIRAEFVHESGDTAEVMLADDDLRGWIDALDAILADYPARTTLQSEP